MQQDIIIKSQEEIATGKATALPRQGDSLQGLICLLVAFLFLGRSLFWRYAHTAPMPLNRHCHRFCAQCLITWSEIEQENPLNLSISISGGKETNKDSPSNGE